MTYNVFGETLNLAQSINQSLKIKVFDVRQISRHCEIHHHFHDSGHGGGLSHPNALYYLHCFPEIRDMLFIVHQQAISTRMHRFHPLKPVVLSRFSNPGCLDGMI